MSTLSVMADPQHVRVVAKSDGSCPLSVGDVFDRGLDDAGSADGPWRVVGEPVSVESGSAWRVPVEPAEE